ncbi:MAG: Fe-S cluster assembly protein SufD [Dokdonella sp.]
MPAGREHLAAALLRDGLPGARDEAWKYTNLRALEQRSYAVGDAQAATRAIDLDALLVPIESCARLVFVNGVFRHDLSNVQLVTGLQIGRSVDDGRGESAPTDGDLSGARSAAFSRLNAVLATDGPQVTVLDGATIAQPLLLIFVGVAADADLAWNVLARFDLGAGASLKVIEHHVAASPNAHLGNLVVNHALGAGAHLDLVQLQEAAPAATLIRRTTCRLEDTAVLSMHTVETGAQLMRHDLVVDLVGRGARFESRGVFALQGRQHADTHMVVTHDARDTACDIVWRGVADQRSRGVFHGAITVAPGADGSDAKLSNKNLLLSPNAEIDTQPVLEIYADEVKAAHGATVGQLDERALFYLRSRGMPLDLARRILVGAFCGAVLAEIRPTALRAHIDTLLAARLPQAETGE